MLSKSSYFVKSILLNTILLGILPGNIYIYTKITLNSQKLHYTICSMHIYILNASRHFNNKNPLIKIKQNKKKKKIVGKTILCFIAFRKPYIYIK